MTLVEHCELTLRRLMFNDVIKKRFYVQKAWFALVLGWALVRIVTAEVYFSQYGINIWIFATIEIISSPVLARSSSQLTIVLKNHRIPPSFLWGGLTLVSFAAPDVYLLTAGRGLPWVAYGLIFLVMTIGGSVSVIKLQQKNLRGAPLGKLND